MVERLRVSDNISIDPMTGAITEDYGKSHIPFNAQYQTTDVGLRADFALKGLPVGLDGPYETTVWMYRCSAEFQQYDRPERMAILLVRGIRALLSDVELDIVRGASADPRDAEEEEDECEDTCCNDGPVDGEESDEELAERINDVDERIRATLGEGHGPNSDCPTCELIFTSL